MGAFDTLFKNMANVAGTGVNKVLEASGSGERVSINDLFNKMVEKAKEAEQTKAQQQQQQQFVEGPVEQQEDVLKPDSEKEDDKSAFSAGRKKTAYQQYLEEINNPYPDNAMEEAQWQRNKDLLNEYKDLGYDFSGYDANNLTDDQVNKISEAAMKRSRAVDSTVPDYAKSHKNAEELIAALANPVSPAEQTADATRNAVKRANQARRENQDYFYEDSEGNKKLNEELVNRDLGTWEGFAPAILAKYGLTAETDPNYEMHLGAVNNRNSLNEADILADPGKRPRYNKDPEELVAKLRQENADMLYNIISSDPSFYNKNREKYDLEDTSESNYTSDDLKKKIELENQIEELTEGDLVYSIPKAERDEQIAELKKQLEEIQPTSKPYSERLKEFQDEQQSDYVALAQDLAKQTGASYEDLLKKIGSLSDEDVKKAVGEAKAAEESEAGGSEATPTKAQIDEYYDWINSGSPAALAFLARYGDEYGGENGYSRARMSRNMDLWRDLYGYGDLEGIAGWKDYVSGVGINPDDEDAWDRFWDYIAVQNALRKSDFTSDARESQNRWGSGRSTDELMKYVASQEGIRNYGDLLNASVLYSMANEAGLNNIDENDVAEYMLLSQLTNLPADQLTGMSVDDLLALANSSLADAGDIMEFGLVEDGSPYAVEDRPNKQKYNASALGNGTLNVNPYGGDLLDWNMIDTWYDLIRKQAVAEGMAEDRIGLAKRS